MTIQIAEATSHILQNKSIKIYPDQLIVGNYTPKRVGGIICPELHGLTALIEISTFNERAANPLQPSRAFERDPTYSMR
jgi:formate C-acetyltransferase